MNEILNPKSEIRTKPEIRNSNRKTAPDESNSDFGLRISFGFRISGFGFVSSVINRELQLKAVLLCLCFSPIKSLAGHDMRFDSVDGDVTPREYQSFIEHLDGQLPPTPSNNIGNVLSYERVGGGTLHGMQTFYS